MSLTMKTKTVLDAATFTWPDDNPSVPTDGLEKYENHLITISGAGTGTITVDQGSGYQPLDTLSSDFNTYLLPNAVGIKVVASVDDLVLSIKSYG